MGYIRNAVLIHAPLADVFKLTNNVRTWPELFTEYASSEVLEEEENRVLFRLTTKPDEAGMQWSWLATRWTNEERKATYSERDASSGPFEQMKIRWWYDGIGEKETIMTWEQEFTVKPTAPLTDDRMVDYLNGQTKIQQRVIKDRVEQICGTSEGPAEIYRGVIIGKHTPGSEEEIVKAWERSDATELPHLIGVESRHVWVQGDIYVHFVEGKRELPTIMKEYIHHPLYSEVKAELDQYVSLIYPDLPAHGKQIYAWRKGDEA